MSSTTPDDADSQPDEQAVLSHLVQRLLQREGGQVPLERVTLRVSDYVDIGERAAADLIDEGVDAGIYTLERGAGGTTTITGVSPQGPEPDIIVAAFGTGADTPEFTVISVVTESIDQALRDAGYETFSSLADAGADDLTGLTGTLTQSRAAAMYLSRMAEQGDLEVVETAEGTCYKPDPVTQFLDEVRDLAETHSQEELTAELRDIADEIGRWKREYDVESLAELRQSVGDDDLSAEQRHERLDIVEEWEYDVEMREAIRLAIGLTESLTELGAGADPGYTPDSQPQEG